ncbi:MAG: hypothetical protein HYY63_07040 [Elusimicrobia bacterium]|nr:hypothetical protein [Elusimicrobiota bacterium]MBI3013364.1 hypothetical protein [Elusimicrobiota bacterium]
MFLNYLAGTVSLLLAVSAFIPWVTVWFYSLKGIESIYGILILIVGLLGVTVAIFQHLSGKVRGRGFILFALISLACEALYFRKLATYGSKLNEIVGLLTDLFGEALIQKLQQLVGEQWTKVLIKVVQRVGRVDTDVSGFDFIGGGLILAAVCALILLSVGALIEKNRPKAEI